MLKGKRMTLRHMKIFVAVFKNSSITKASEELHLAQPSVSFSIKEMENYYGVRLFERIGRRIIPTECGKEFYSYAVHIVSVFEEMEKKIKNWDNIGTLRIGTSITIGTKILPELIKNFQKKCPELRIEAAVSKSEDVERAIMNSAIDIGLIENITDNPDIISEPFMRDTLCPIVSTGHPLTRKGTVSLEELSAYPLLMREKGSAGREILESYLSIYQIPVQPLWESSSTQAIVEAVAGGIGVAILPYLLVEKDIIQNKVEKLGLDPPIERNLNIIRHRSKFITPNMLLFIEMCRNYEKQDQPTSFHSQ